jgi:hypothetical protein
LLLQAQAVEVEGIEVVEVAQSVAVLELELVELAEVLTQVTLAMLVRDTEQVVVAQLVLGLADQQVVLA